MHVYDKSQMLVISIISYTFVTSAMNSRICKTAKYKFLMISHRKILLNHSNITVHKANDNYEENV